MRLKMGDNVGRRRHHVQAWKNGHPVVCGDYGANNNSAKILITERCCMQVIHGMSLHPELSNM